MPRAAFIQESFLGGEWTPRAQGRVSSPRYSTALHRLYNMIPLLQGPMTRRPGTIHAHTTKDHGYARLIGADFPHRGDLDTVVSENNNRLHSFEIEFGNLYCRFFKNHEIVTETPIDILGCTNTNPCKITTNGPHGFSTGDRIWLKDIGGVVGLNLREVTVTVVDADEFTIGINTTVVGDWGTYGAGTGTAGLIYEIVSPYTDGDVDELQITQNDRAVYLFHGSFPPYQLTFDGDFSWTLVPVVINDGPYLDENTTSTTLTLTGALTAGSTVTVTASSTTGINDDLPTPGFSVADIDRWVRFMDANGNIDAILITAFTSVTQVDGTLLYGSLASGAARTTWRLGLWSDTYGWPIAGTFHEARLCAGGAAKDTSRVDCSHTDTSGFASVSFALTNTTGDISDADAVPIVLQTKRASVLSWLSSTEAGLVAGTLAGTFAIRGADDGALTPTSIKRVRIAAKGAAPIAPIESNSRLLYAHSLRRKVFEIAPGQAGGPPETEDLTLTGEHLTLSGIEEMVLQDEPHSILWARKSDGALRGCTYFRDEQIFEAGWHQHELATYDSSLDTITVESITTAAAPDGLSFELWLIVNRTGEFGTERSIEYLGTVFAEDDVLSSAAYLDMSIYQEIEVTAGATEIDIGGLSLYDDHGALVNIFMNGVWASTTGSVTNGRIADVTVVGTPFHTSEGEGDPDIHAVRIGLAFESEWQLLRPEAGAADGTSIGKTRRAHRIALQLFQTLGLMVGTDFDNLHALPADQGGDVPASPDTGVLFSGIVDDSLDDDYDFDARICGRFSGPVPATIVSVTGLIETQDR